MKLPPLPEELARFTESEGQHRALKSFVLDYGYACREAVLDEIKAKIEALKNASTTN